MPNFKEWFQKKLETASATEKAQGAGITFAVDDVEPLDCEFWLTDLHDSLSLRAGEKVLIMPEGNRPALAAEGYSRRRMIPAAGEPQRAPGPLEPNRQHYARMIEEAGRRPHPFSQRDFLHPLVQAVDLAFAEHRPLKLTPDSIWMAIVQGFGHHVRENAEALRDRIVRHEGKQTIAVTASSLEESAWPGMIAQFSAGIRNASNPVLYEALIGDFSTTTPHIHTAYEAALMDAYQDYFDYMMIAVCGIPTISVEGAVGDWQRMRDRIEVLATYDLEWWVGRLRPILDQFIATATGSPDRDFWKAIFKPERPYGAMTISGWLGDFFPYLRNTHHGWYRNRLLDLERTNWQLPKHEKADGFPGVNMHHTASGLSRAPITIQFADGSGREQSQVDLVGGFLGVGQEEDTNALYPILSWGVVERPSGPTPEQEAMAQFGREQRGQR